MKKTSLPLPATVYRITNLVNGKFYIGVTTQSLQRRLSQHLATALRSNGPLHTDMRVFGRDAFSIEPVSAHPDLESGVGAERRLIEVLAPPYNVLAGGKNERQVICLDDGLVFESASAAARHYKTAKSSIIEVCLRNPVRVQARGRVFRYVGDVLDAEVELETAKRRTAERAGRGSYKLKKRVVCVNDGMEFDSAKEAADHYRVHRTSIGQVARGEADSVKGLRFKYMTGG